MGVKWAVDVNWDRGVNWAVYGTFFITLTSSWSQIIKHRWSVAGDDVLIVWDLEGFGDK